MKLLRYLFACLMLLGPLTAGASRSHGGEGVDVKEVVLGHLSDAHDWHMATWGDVHLTIPLPVIVYSATSGWHCFSSARLTESADGYRNFYLSASDGKIYERVGGEAVKPLDLSITKNVAQIWIAAVLVIAIFLCCARRYKGRKPSDDAPGGFVGLMEMFVMMVYDDIVVAGIGRKHAPRYAPYILTVFFFVFTINLLGLIPFFPGGANVTGNISITCFLALCTFLVVNLFGNREYWKEVFWPDVPMMLKCPVPLMPVIELFGLFIKPFALMVRLFANIMGGHAVILSLTCVIFVTFQVSVGIGSSLSVVSFLLMIFMDCLEVLVAFIQAYVFAMLSSVFIGLAHVEHPHKP